MTLAAWENDYSNHQVWRLIDDTLGLIVSQTELNPEQLENAEYVRMALELAKGWHDAPSPLVSKGMLLSLDNAVRQNVNDHLRAWESNGQARYLTAAFSGADAVLDALRGWPITKDRTARILIGTMRSTIGEAERALASLQSEVESDRSEFQQSLKESESRVNEIGTEASRRLQEVEQALIRAESNLTGLELAISTQLVRLDNALNANQDTFVKAEAGRRTENEETLDAHKDEFEAEILKAVAESKIKLEQQDSTANGILSRIRSLETKARNAAESTAAARTSTEYGAHAKEQGRVADQLRWVAIGLFIAAFLAGASGWVISEWRRDDSWTTALIKTTLAVTLIAAAGYAIKESSNHRNEEIRSKSAQLRLEALEPFISNLDAKDIRVLRMAAAQDLFIVKDNQHFSLPALEDEEAESL